MKTYLKLGAAALVLFASTAIAQTGNGSDITGGTVSATVGGVFNPGSGSTPGGPAAVTAPASTPVTPAGPPPSPAVAAVMAGTPAAVATFSAALTTAGLPSAAAAGIANALTSLQAGGAMTFGNVATAVNAWNAVLATLTPTQLQSLVRSPQGRAAFGQIRAAARGARAAARP